MQTLEIKLKKLDTVVYYLYSSLTFHILALITIYVCLFLQKKILTQ